MSLFKSFGLGMKKTRDSLLNAITSVTRGHAAVTPEMLDELEETLILADVGAATSAELIASLRRRRELSPEALPGALAESIAALLTEGAVAPPAANEPTVWLVIGVNGVGKTTTIGKLASIFKKEGRKVLLAAADTFRAAAIDQLVIWGERAAAPVIRHKEGADPAAVVHDAAEAAKAGGYDVLLCDTAGRLHNKKNLMDELGKIRRVLTRVLPEYRLEVLLVLDATTGQNALVQARQFKEVAGITALALTKLDGTAKGGVVLSIVREVGVPVRFAGVGEGIDDLLPFDAASFARALVGVEEGA